MYEQNLTLNNLSGIVRSKTQQAYLTQIRLPDQLPYQG